MAAENEIVLEAAGITKTFPGVRALDGVGLGVRRGRLVAVLGENGAGKSTLMNILAGVFPPDAGTIRLGGREMRFANPREAQAHGISIVFQELSLIPHLSVAENIFLGREPRSRAGLIDYRRMNGDAVALLRRLDLSTDPSSPVGRLRVGQQQIVEIARAVSTDAQVLILDEPTSSLSAHEVDVLFSVIADLKNREVAIVYITHKFEELARIGDDVVVMRDGQVVGEGPLSDFTRDTIVRLMAGNLGPRASRPHPNLADGTSAVPGRKGNSRLDKSSGAPGEELLRVENLSLRSRGAGRPFLFDDVSFSLCRGEVLGVFGLVGAGRTELLEALFGLHAAEVTGQIVVAGQPVQFKSPADAIAAGIALAPEDRKRDGLVLEMSVAANASLGSLDRTLRGWLVSERREAALVTPYLDRFQVKMTSSAQCIRNLSGGNQQKVILAKWLATGPRILLLDEPTRGIDINAKREIYAFVEELARSGLGVIVVSSELTEVLALSDCVMVMCEGRKTAEFDRAGVTGERVLHAALPDLVALTKVGRLDPKPLQDPHKSEERS